MQTSELKTQFFRRPIAPQPVVTEAPTPASTHTLADSPTQLWFPAETAQPQALPIGNRPKPYQV